MQIPLYVSGRTPQESYAHDGGVVLSTVLLLHMESSPDVPLPFSSHSKREQMHMLSASGRHGMLVVFGGGALGLRPLGRVAGLSMHVEVPEEAFAQRSDCKWCSSGHGNPKRGTAGTTAAKLSVYSVQIALIGYKEARVWVRRRGASSLPCIMYNASLPCITPISRN